MRYTEIAAPLEDLLKDVLRKQTRGKRNKTAAKKISLVGEWKKEHQECFVNIKKCLTDSVVLSRLDLTKHLCLFTDASDKFYAACITAIPSCDTEKLPTEMNHEIIDTMSGKFSGSAERWSIQSKEAFAIKHAMDKWSHWFDGPNDLIVFTDSQVVKFIFDPHRKGTPAALGAAQAGRVARWALFLRRFSFEIRHLPGSLNVFADYLSRDGSMYAILARPDAGFSNSEKSPADAANKPVQPRLNSPACARAVEGADARAQGGA